MGHKEGQSATHQVIQYIINIYILVGTHTYNINLSAVICTVCGILVHMNVQCLHTFSFGLPVVSSDYSKERTAIYIAIHQHVRTNTEYRKYSILIHIT